MKLKTALLLSHKISKDLKGNFALNSAIFLSIFILFFASSIIYGFEKELHLFYQKIPEAIYIQDSNLSLEEQDRDTSLLLEKKIVKESIAFAIVDYQQLILKQNNDLKFNEIILPSSFKKNHNNNIVSNNNIIQLTYLKNNGNTTTIQDEEFVIKGYVQNNLLSKNIKFGYISNKKQDEKSEEENNDEGESSFNSLNSLFTKELVFLYDNVEKYQDFLFNKQIIFKKSDLNEDFKDIDVLKIFIYLLGFLLLLIASFNINSTVNYFITTKKEEFFILSMIGYSKKDLFQIEWFLTFKLFFKPLFISILLSLITLYGLNLFQLFIKNNYHITLLNPEVYFIDTIPFEINIIEKILIMFFIILITCFKK